MMIQGGVEVSDQLRVQAALTSKGKRSPVPIGLDHSRCGLCGKRKIPFTMPGIKLQPSRPLPVTVPTELFLLIVDVQDEMSLDRAFAV
jgi:hypothetical protein